MIWSKPEHKPAEVQKALETLSDNIREQAENLEEHAQEVSDYIEDLQSRCEELRDRAEDMGEQIGVESKSFGKTVDLSIRVTALENELNALNDQTDTLFVRFGAGELDILKQGMSDDAAESFLDFLDSELDTLESQADDIEGKLDDIEEMLDSIEDETNDRE